jgi:hypothetical protein
MIAFHADLSLNTLIISGVVALVGYALKGAMWALGEICKNLISTLVNTIAKVELLDAKVSQVIEAVGDVHKIRSDLNGFYSRLKSIEEKLGD